jgi:hypothetical protein
MNEDYFYRNAWDDDYRNAPWDDDFRNAAFGDEWRNGPWDDDFRNARVWDARRRRWINVPDRRPVFQPVRPVFQPVQPVRPVPVVPVQPVQPAQTQPTTPTQPQPGSNITCGQSPFRDQFGQVRTGLIIDAVAQTLAAFAPLPPAPEPTGEVGIDQANSITYLAALAQHAKTDEKVRTVSKIIQLFVRN